MEKSEENHDAWHYILYGTDFTTMYFENFKYLKKNPIIISLNIKN